jgi:uncharacterized protein (DUF2267 family)
MAELHLADRHQAYLALRATLHALRDRLTVDEAAHLGAQLPMLIRGLYYEGWTPRGKPIKWHRDEFLDHIRAHCAVCDDVDPEHVARAVFKVLAARVSAGEVKDVTHVLPKELQALWPPTH